MDNLGNNSRAVLKDFVERVERLSEERDSIGSDIKDVLAEAKSQGFDAKTMRAVIRLRKKDKDEREQEQTLIETYMRALGMNLDGTDAED